MRLNILFLAFAFLILIFASGCAVQNQQPAGQQAGAKTGEQEEYNPVINPADFSLEINNKYFTLTPGAKFSYESTTEDGLETGEAYVTNETKNIAGVETRVVHDRVWLDGELIEETFDWYAQDKEGNVWYFGEDSRGFLNGEIVSRAGSWETGVDGAKPGIIMKAAPKIGDEYRQEYFVGEAEDMAKVLALGETVETSFGIYTDCLKTQDWTPLEPGADEYKYYCPEVGGIVLETNLDASEKNELKKIER